MVDDDHNPMTTNKPVHKRSVQKRSVLSRSIVKRSIKKRSVNGRFLFRYRWPMPTTPSTPCPTRSTTTTTTTTTAFGPTPYSEGARNVSFPLFQYSRDASDWKNGVGHDGAWFTVDLGCEINLKAVGFGNGHITDFES